MNFGAILRVDGVRGQCDRRCHLSASARCRCICAGRFHGVGLDEAWDAMAAAVAGGEFGDGARMSGFGQWQLPGFERGERVATPAP